MNDLYQQSTQETDAMFKQSTEKFGTMVQHEADGRRDAPASSRRPATSCAAACWKCRRRQPTSTAQMRKVIVDQIEALAELNRIVAHHGRGLDVVTSGRASVQRQEEPVAMVAAGGRDEVRMRDSGGGSASTLPPPDLGAAGLAPHRGAAGLAGDPPGRRDATDGSPTSSTAPTQRRRRREAPRGRSPQGAVNPLESLSLDIARLMDRNLAAEMWDRYQRGETKAFTKRLYTPAGQKAFDEVARKYRADRSFKQTVDRYIAEFERLLDEVAREERGPAGAARPPHLGDRPGLHPARPRRGTAGVSVE